jgi:hypothetical protein
LTVRFSSDDGAALAMAARPTTAETTEAKLTILIAVLVAAERVCGR